VARGGIADLVIQKERSGVENEDSGGRKAVK
jgi:hypothetical protein